MTPMTTNQTVVIGRKERGDAGGAAVLEQRTESTSTARVSGTT